MTAIGAYFRTALLIDDSAVDTTEDLEPLGPIPADSEPTRLVETPSEGTPLSWNNIVNAFLKVNVVCSVLRPNRKDNILDMAIRGSKVADLLILDWDLFGDDGEDTKKAILRIIETDPRRLRVIVIYTEMSFRSVTDALIKECGLTKESGHIFCKEATIVLVFSKSSVRLMEGEEGSDRIASYSDLPKRIRKDLEDYFGGLVPELAFNSINIIRESAPRVLATFDSSLDAPLLAHRALLPDTSDAGPQFIRLLTSELGISLMESSLTDMLSDDSIHKILNQTNIVKEPELCKELPDIFKTHPDHKRREISELVGEVVTLGFEEMGLTDDAPSIGRRQLKRLINQFFDCFGVGEEPHKSLAVLMSSTQFGDVIPRLEAGIVLENKGKYWLCIQPLCDSVRLTNSRRFPLLPLIINANQDGSIKSRSAAMIWAANSKAIPVKFGSSIYDLEMPEFEPEGKLFVEAQEENGKWWFEDKKETRYRAVCRLRDEFVQQAVQGLTSGVARPGIDSSEWLRRLSRG